MKDNGIKNRPRFYMMSGLPGSGKTFLARKLVEEAEACGRKIAWISSDKIREELYGSEEEQGNPAKVFEILRQRVMKALNAGSDVIYDACNISTKRRKAFLMNLKNKDCEKICLIAATPYGECLERNRNRGRKVPEESIERMYMGWCTPAVHEGWDQIRLCYSPGSEGSLGDAEAFIREHMEYDQTNPHHMETLGQHLLNISAYLREKGVDGNSNLAIAAMLHDCGKPFTRKVDTREDGREIAHYYQHANVGSYDAMFYDFSGRGKSMEDVLEISLMIGLHMNPFSWKKNGGNEKSRSAWGDELYDAVSLLNEADEAASEAEQDTV